MASTDPMKPFGVALFDFDTKKAGFMPTNPEDDWMIPRFVEEFTKFLNQDRPGQPQTGHMYIKISATGAPDFIEEDSDGWPFDPWLENGWPFND